MKKQIHRCLYFCFLICCIKCEKPRDFFKLQSQNDENRLLEQIFATIEHYKQDGPVGLPDIFSAEIPDPMLIPDVKKSFPVATMHMKDIKTFGLSNLRIVSIKTDIKNLQIKFEISVNEMRTIGNYTLQSFTKSEGEFMVVVKDVYIQGNVSLGIERNGKLKTQDIQIDISFDDMSMNFQNLGMMGSVFQGFVNSAPNAVFELMKPYILSEAYTKIRSEADTNLDKLLQDYCFSNSISPIDIAVIKLRKQIRSKGYDPFKVPDFNHAFGILGLGAKVKNMLLTGISSFYRVGDVTMKIENNTVVMRMDFGTQKITGETEWGITTFGGITIRSGRAHFSIAHIKTSIKVSQTLDTRKRSQIKDIQLDIGNIQLRCDGAGTLDYIVEILINLLPNLIRYQLIDAIENPLKYRIQETLNKINVEEVIKTKVLAYFKYGVIGINFDF